MPMRRCIGNKVAAVAMGLCKWYANEPGGGGGVK